MRNLMVESGKVIGWDKELPTCTAVDFQWILGDPEGAVSCVTFPRCIKLPEGEPVGDPMLLMFGDGSQESSCALAYV
jgi:hypothetical protein